MRCWLRMCTCMGGPVWYKLDMLLLLLLLRQARLQENLLELFRAVLNFEITIRI